MSETASNVVTYTPLIGGDGESRWIRLEQVQATLPGPSVGYMAEMLDYAFGIEACDDGLGGGGEEAGDGPTDEEIAETLSITLTNAGQCRQGYWLGAINVYRTHERPDYELRSETAKVETVTLVRESYRQVVDVNGPLIELERPYAGNLQGIPPNVNWTVRGATVNLDRPVHDRLTLRYETWHEYVTLRVPTRRTDDGEEYEAAAVVAFWGDLAAECELRPPEPEDPENQAAIDELCRKQRPEKPEPTDCWKTIHHYSMCNCSRARFNEWDEQMSAPCDGASSGAQVGYEEKFDGFGGCEGEEDEVNDPEYYKKRCCHYPTRPLPRCRRSYADYTGGHEIDSGPAHWRNIYGPDVRMVAVLPENGKCGERITEWNVPQKNCCDGVEPLSLDPKSDKEILVPEHRYFVQVLGGKGGVDFRWETFGGILIDAGGVGVTTFSGGRAVSVYFEKSACPRPGLTVTDGCSELTIYLTGPGGDPPSLDATDLELGPRVSFWMTVSGGVPGYMWMAGGGLILERYTPDGSAALFTTPNDVHSWCVAEVTVVDSCGQSASATVRNATSGQWWLVSSDQYNRCSPPGSPYPGRIEGQQGGMTVTPPADGYSNPSGGYYAYLSTERCSYPTVSDADTTVCGGGNDLSGLSPYWEDFCKNRWPSGWTGTYDRGSGKCVGQSRWGDVRYCYLSEYAAILYRWVCE